MTSPNHGKSNSGSPPSGGQARRRSRNRTPTPTRAEQGTPTNTRQGTPAHTRQGTPAHTRQGTPTNTGQGTPAHTRQGTPAHTRQGTPTHTTQGTPAHTRQTTPTRGELRVEQSGLQARSERGDVVQLQRARIVSAMVDVVLERGIAGASVAHVVTRSGVSRRTFYELFADREDCFLAALELAIERGTVRVRPAFNESATWLLRVRAGLRALLEFLDDEPALGRLAVVDVLGAGSAALARRAQVLQMLIDAVDRGRREQRAPARLTRLTAEGVVGAVLAVLHTRILEGQRKPMVCLLGPLMGMLALPYLGRATAEREAAAPAPRRRPAAPPPTDPLRDLQMRLTYRTVRVLAAIAAAPGASNREIADAAGVTDQGQISKLLTRLEHLELARNSGQGHAKGEPNNWHLTPMGHQLQQTIHDQTTSTAVDSRH